MRIADKFPSMTENSTPDDSPRSEFDAVRAFSVDDAFEALGHRRRRTALACLRERGRPTTLAELAREVSARERESDAADVADADPKSVAASLHHVHLPKLAAAGIVERDGDGRTVTVADDVDQLDPILGIVTD